MPQKTAIAAVEGAVNGAGAIGVDTAKAASAAATFDNARRDAELGDSGAYANLGHFYRQTKLLEGISDDL